MGMNRPFLVIPEANTREAAIVGDVHVYGVRSLADVVQLLNDFDAQTPLISDSADLLRNDRTGEPDFCDVKGQEHVKRALEVAAAGGHNILIFAQKPTRVSKSRFVFMPRDAATLGLPTVDGQRFCFAEWLVKCTGYLSRILLSVRRRGLGSHSRL